MKNKKNWLYATIIFISIGLSLIIYGVYGFNITSNMDFVEMDIGDEFKYSYLSDDLEMEADDDVFTISEIDPDALDQFQLQQANGYGLFVGVNTATGNLNIYQQDGWNDREPWNAFSFVVAKSGTPIHPLVVGVMKNHNRDPTNDNNYKFLGSLYPSQLPESDHYYKISCEQLISDIYDYDVWAIVMFSFNNNYPDGMWIWAGNENNPYPRGWARIYDYWDENDWVDIQSRNVDLLFETYTIPPDNPSEPPVISISSDYNVISMFIGGVSWIAAVGTGSKFLLIKK